MIQPEKIQLLRLKWEILRDRANRASARLQIARVSGEVMEPIVAIHANAWQLLESFEEQLVNTPELGNVLRDDSQEESQELKDIFANAYNSHYTEDDIMTKGARKQSDVIIESNDPKEPNEIDKLLKGTDTEVVLDVVDDAAGFDGDTVSSTVVPHETTK